MLKTRKNQYTTRENDIDFATLNQYHVTRDDTVVGWSLAVILQDEMGMNAKQDLVSQRIDAAAAERCFVSGRPKRRSHFLIYSLRSIFTGVRSLIPDTKKIYRMTRSY
jgi:hypothetical protein